MAGTVHRVVVLVQENHTVDNYFRALAAYGANVAADWPPQPAQGRSPPRPQGLLRVADRQEQNRPAPPVRHRQAAALLRLPGADRRLLREPLLRVRHQLDVQPPADRGRPVADPPQPPTRRPAGLGPAVAARPGRCSWPDLEGLHGPWGL